MQDNTKVSDGHPPIERPGDERKSRDRGHANRSTAHFEIRHAYSADVGGTRKARQRGAKELAHAGKRIYVCAKDRALKYPALAASEFDNSKVPTWNFCECAKLAAKGDHYSKRKTNAMEGWASVEHRVRVLSWSTGDGLDK